MMEATIAASVPYIKRSNPLSSLFSSSSSAASLSFFNSSQHSIPVSSSPLFTSLCIKNSTTKQPVIQFKTKPFGRRKRSLWSVNTSDAENPSSSSENAERWVLEPVGDGDSRHIGFKVAMPDAFEIASSVVTVGRLPEKADMVIPVATVSGLHARIKKKEGCLLVTDLNSTNGTFIDDKRLKPGEVATISPGSCITFGDTNLAMFRVSKLENVDLPRRPEDSEVKPDTDVLVDASEVSS